MFQILIRVSKELRPVHDRLLIKSDQQSALALSRGPNYIGS